MLSGLNAWVLQRVSAIYLALYSIILFFMMLGEDFNYQQWLILKADVYFVISTLVAGIFLFIHCWVGIRDIILDYAQGPVMRLFFLISLAVVLVLQFVWFILIFIS